MTEIFIIIGLMVFNGLFAMAEMALVSVRKPRLEAQAAKGDDKAKKALDLSNHPDTFIATVQFVITASGLLTGIFSGEKVKVYLLEWLNNIPVLKPYSSSLATTILLVVVSYFTLIFGELLPKRIGLSNPEGIAKLVAGPMQFFSKLTFPFIWLLNATTQLLSTMFGIKRNDTMVTEEEIKAIINEGTDQGTIQEAEQEIIERVFHLSDRNITSLMTHRSDIDWLDASMTVAEVIDSLSENVHAIYPVCEGQIDALKGTISVKDLLKAPSYILVGSLAKPALYIPENNSAYQVLEKFKINKIHHSFIVDEYGSIEGMITLNDILDAIIGDVSQQGDNSYEITQKERGLFSVDAQIPFYDFLKYFNKTEWLEEEETDFDTLAGFILKELQEIPVPGRKLSWRGFSFEITDMDNHRIDKVLVNAEGIEDWPS